MSYYRTKETRELQSRLIHQWRPWEKSIGPRSVEGKRVVSQNSYKGGVRPKQRAIAKALREQGRMLKKVE